MEAKTIHEDFIAMQKDLPIVVKKDAENPFYKSGYLSLPRLLEVSVPILHKHHFALIQHPTTLEGVPALKTEIAHVSGESISSIMLLQGKTADPQGQGSAISYARRYALTAILGLAADDDDGQSATEQTKSAGGADKPGLIKPATLNALATTARETGYIGDVGRTFSTMTIKKERPENEAEANQLIEAMKVNPAVPFGG